MMNFINSLLPSNVVEAFGWMILHSLWQGAVISIILGLLMILTRKFSAKSRYFISIVAMLFMPGTAVYTFFRYYTPEKAVEIVQAPVTKTPVAAGTIQIADNEISSAVQPETEKGISTRLKSYRKYFYQHIPLIVTLWMLGMLVFALKFLGGLAYTQRLKHYRVESVSDEWEQAFKRLSGMLKLNKATRILQSTLVKVPMVIGYFKPVVLIPVSAFTGLSPKQLEIIILHELAHIVRRDYIINMLQSVVEIIFFYHPAVWWMSKIVRAEREHCCDDIAIEKSGDSVNYARALANIQEQILVNENLAMAIGGGSNNLIKRIKRLLNQPNMKTNFTEGFTASCIIFAGIFIMMLNTGSARFTSGENMESKSEQFRNAALYSVDDTVKTVTSKKAADQGNAEDRLFEMEQREKAEQMRKESEKMQQLAEEQREKAEQMRKESEKMRRLAEEQRAKAIQMRKEAEKARLDAEIKRKEVEVDMLKVMQKRNEAESINNEKLMEEIRKAEMDLEKSRIEAEKALKESEIRLMEAVKAEKEAEIALEKEKYQTHHSDDPDDLLEEEILEGVEAGLEEMDIDAVVDEAMAGTAAAIEEMDLNTIVREAIEGIHYGVEELDAEIIASEILHGIEAAVYGMDLNVIAGEVMDGIRIALKEIDINGIVEQHIEISSEQETYMGDWEHLDIIRGGVGVWNQWRDENPKIVPDLRGAMLSEANLNSVDFHDALLDNINLKEAVLDWANLEGASLRSAELKEATFNGARMMGADFSGSNMKEVTLSGQLLRNTNFSGANLKEADLSTADLRGADLRGADLSEADLTKAKLQGALIDQYTLLPPGFDPEANGMVME